MTDSSLAALLFLQLACILAACRGLGWLAYRVRQPQVIAEMVAGFLLGPSFLGWLAPGFQTSLFPVASRQVLFVTSQVGLVLYMFCVGLEFRVDLVSRHRRRALSLSAAGIAVPFGLGAALALLMLGRGGFFTDHVTPVQAALFLGAAMSITAFPVLARIISERGIAGTTVGTLALTAGAVDDAAAWVILACALSSFNANATFALAAVLGAVVYAVFVFVGLRPFLLRLAAAVERRDTLTLPMLGTMLALVALGAWFTDAVGIYSVFGAFLLGASVPRGALSRELRRHIEPLTTSLLVPLFFVYSGLNTQLTLVNSTGLALMAALVFVTACLGKGLACWGAARLTGATSRESLAVATLMNARGMVELILINIGFQRGLITPTLFTILVLMAIGTTLMTGPLFSLVWEAEGESLHVASGREQAALD